MAIPRTHAWRITVDYYARLRQGYDGRGRDIRGRLITIGRHFYGVAWNPETATHDQLDEVTAAVEEERFAVEAEDRIDDESKAGARRV